MERTRVLIVAKTRRGNGVCIGAIAADGRSLRLEAVNRAHDAPASLAYAIGDVWEVEGLPADDLTPPHVENFVVYNHRLLRRSVDPLPAIERFMPPHVGGIAVLYEGLLQSTSSGALYVAARTGMPTCSTLFWRPDRTLVRDTGGKRIRYRYPTDNGGFTLTYVGLEPPIEILPAGTLLRVSLAHWWRAEDKPDDELRCYVQLSGWYLFVDAPTSSVAPAPVKRALAIAPVEKPVVHRTPNAVTAEELQATLKRIFGYDAFRPHQEEIIRSSLDGVDTLAILPTGSGKSLCYQLPALLRDGLTVVVSPLIALMQDQVDALWLLGAPAALLNSTVGYATYLETVRLLKRGAIKLLYVAPETLLRPETLAMLDECNVTCLTIDEAHCISQWGHDFRPEYRQLLPVRKRYPSAACLALTATASPRVQRDIEQSLDFQNGALFIASFNRENLHLAAQPRVQGLPQLESFLRGHKDNSGIIYCSTRKQVDQLATQLAALKFSVLPYHAGLDDVTRRNNQRAFVRDEAAIMVATVAFGMGINKPNVRFVVHYNLPASIEQYYQEIGRAGRDGLSADCLLLYAPQDSQVHQLGIEEGAPEERPGRAARLQAMQRFAQAITCRRRQLLAYFGEEYEAENCGHCDVCTGGADNAAKSDVTEAAQRFLETVKQSRQRFGISHVVDILRGSQSARIQKFQHQNLPMYGQGKDLSAKQWRSLAQAVIQQGFATQDMEHGTLSITDGGASVLKGETQVWAVIESERPAKASASDQYDVELFTQLRKLRRTLADSANVPAYMIFSDVTLIAIASFCPRTPRELLALNGVGERKLAQYGAAFLEVVNAYCAEHPPPARDAPPLAASKPKVSPRAQEIGRLYTNGCTIEALMETYGLQHNTIVNHLATFVREGGVLDGARLLEESNLNNEQRNEVFRAFAALGHERLTPVREHLEGRVEYNELHLLRIVWLLLPEDRRAEY